MSALDIGFLEGDLVEVEPLRDKAHPPALAFLETSRRGIDRHCCPPRPGLQQHLDRTGESAPPGDRLLPFHPEIRPLALRNEFKPPPVKQLRRRIRAQRTPLRYRCECPALVRGPCGEPEMLSQNRKPLAAVVHDLSDALTFRDIQEHACNMRRSTIFGIVNFRRTTQPAKRAVGIDDPEFLVNDYALFQQFPLGNDTISIGRMQIPYEEFGRRLVR